MTRERTRNNVHTAFWQGLFRDFRKVGVFALSGALGCLAAAVLGEIWLGTTRMPVMQRPADYTICMLLDTSGSMRGDKLREMKRAATEFVRGRDLSRDRIAVVGFGSFAQTATPLTRDPATLVGAIESLEEGGGTNMGAGLRTAAAVVSGSEGPKSILLFTDGLPDNHATTLDAAEQCRSTGTEIVAVATGDADIEFLSHAVGNPQLVFPALAGQFSSAFQKASEVIGRRQLVEAESGGGSYFREVSRLAVWTGLIAAGLALALVVGQNFYFGRALWRGRENLMAILGGLAAGCLAGMIVQGVFGVLDRLPAMLVLAGRLAGWTALGAMIGMAISRYVPNLRIDRGLMGGTVGGWIGGILFLVLAVIGETGGRLVGAMAVGLAVGGMIAIAEVASRHAWLDIVYGPKEKRAITLGQQTLSIGSHKEFCQIVLPGAASVAFRYSMKDGRIVVEDAVAGRTFEVDEGDTRHVGKVSLIVRRAAASAATRDRPPPRSGPLTGPTSDSGSAAVTATGPGWGPAAAAAPTPAATWPDYLSRAAQATGFFLNARGRVLPLVEGARFTAQSLELRDGMAASDICAEVVPNPAQPGVFGLKNLTSLRWRAVLANGEVREVEPGKSIRLAKGTQITVGQSNLLIE